MKTRRSDNTREYNFGGGVSMITLLGCWEHYNPRFKPNATFFAGPSYHGITRPEAARTLRDWRKIRNDKPSQPRQ